MNDMVRVAVTEPEYRKASAVFEHAAGRGLECICVPAEDAVCAEAVRTHRAKHVVLGPAAYSEYLYDAVPSGGVLARFGVGYDGLDLARATARGLLCTNTPGVLDVSVAEHSMGLVAAAARGVPLLNATTKSDNWAPTVGIELAGKTLAVIGCGNIGCRVARIAAFGYGMRVVGCKTRPADTEAMKRDFGFERIVYDFAEAVEGAHFVSLHIPSTAVTRGFINRERLAQLPRDAWLINTSRGAVVDEAALFDVLRDGALGGAALDVFEQEPYTPVEGTKDLHQLKNVIMTPHVGSATNEACERMAARALENIVLAVEGRVREMDLLNPEVLNREK